MSTAYAGEAKTDAREPHVIAETVRHRGDLTLVDVPAALVTELRLLVTHRTDLVTHRTDRVRMINRLRDVLSGYFPALERGVRLLHQSWSSGPPHRLSDAGRDPRPRPFSPGDLAYGPKGPQRRAHRRGCTGGRQRAAHHRPRAGRRGEHRRGDRRGTAGARPAHPCPGRTDRSDLPRPPPSQDPRVMLVSARHRRHPRRRAHRRRRGPVPIRRRWSPCLRRRAGLTSCMSRATPAAAPATCTARCATPAGCAGCSTSPRKRR